jgi:hypothetical protein
MLCILVLRPFVQISDRRFRQPTSQHRKFQRSAYKSFPRIAQIIKIKISNMVIEAERFAMLQPERYASFQIQDEQLFEVSIMKCRRILFRSGDGCW